MSAIAFQLIFRQKGKIMSQDDVSDFSEPFFAIIENWANRNVEKFQRGLGSEATGVQQATDNFWEPDTEEYSKAKAKKGFADWLMVRTGALAESLSNPDAFFQMVFPTKASFGVPNDEEASDHAAFNWMKRQSIFLDETDKLGIRRQFKDFLDFGPGYAEQKLRLAALKEEFEVKYLEFSDAVEYA